MNKKQNKKKKEKKKRERRGTGGREYEYEYEFLFQQGSGISIIQSTYFFSTSPVGNPEGKNNQNKKKGKKN